MSWRPAKILFTTQYFCPPAKNRNFRATVIKQKYTVSATPTGFSRVDSAQEMKANQWRRLFCQPRLRHWRRMLSICAASGRSFVQSLRFTHAPLNVDI